MPHGDVETYHSNGMWHNRIEGTGEIFGGNCARKQDAVAVGRAEARLRKVEHIIQNLDGTIHERSTYGHDPRNIPG
jgi:hypothetical protein